MFKQLLALMRGRTYDATEAFVDANAITILRQQIRDCAEAVAAARKAVAVAIAQNEQEVAQTRKLIERIDDLEARTVSALEQGKADLAREAAESIALMDAERTASEQAQRNFAVEIERLKRIVRASEMRLRELQRGQRLAVATDRTQRLRETAPASSLSALRDAEETLSRLRARQTQIDATAVAMAEMEQSGDPAALADKLAAAGCGAPTTTTADALLERLRQRMQVPA